MKKIFGEINLTWKKVILWAIVIGVAVGLLNSVPMLKDTTVTDIATYFDFWILCGILIIMNSKSNIDSALKCETETLKYDDTYKAYLEDSSYGDLNIEYMDSIECFCIHASFKKPGDTKVVLESPDGDKEYFNIHIGKMTYSFDEDD